MKPNRRLKYGWLVGVVLVLAGRIGVAQTTFLFNENFDGAAYTDGGTVPTGFNLINLGEWLASDPATTPVITSGSYAAPSSPRVLELGAGGAVAGVLGTNNLGPAYNSWYTTNAIDVKFAFNLPSTSQQVAFYV